MSEISLLGPTARPMVQLGGAVAWRTRTIKGIVCSFQWLDLRKQGFEDTPEHASVACMCLFRPASHDRGAYVVPQPHAFHYGDKNGNPTTHLATAAFAAAEQLGFDMRDKHAIRTIIDIIIEGLPDLILMPSEAPENTDVIVKKAIQGIEASATVNGKTIHQEVL
jgi:hypothetical protein